VFVQWKDASTNGMYIHSLSDTGIETAGTYDEVFGAGPPGYSMVAPKCTQSGASHDFPVGIVEGEGTDPPARGSVEIHLWMPGPGNMDFSEDSHPGLLLGDP